MPVIDISIVARLEEARIAAVFSEMADVWRPVAGGVMSRAAPGSWLNTVVGAGHAGPVGADAVPAIVDFYSSMGIEPRVELCPLADESFIAALAGAGFVVRSFDSVLYRELNPGDVFETPYPPPQGLVIERVDPSDAAAVREYAIAQMSGFTLPGEPLHETSIESAERAVRHPRSIALAARLPQEAGRRVVAAGGIERWDELSTLYGLSVAEPFRRRGIQQAMMAHRLKIAAEHGSKFASIGSRPGAHTERNVRRMGFHVAYTKASLVRPGPGLVPTFSN